MCLSERRSVRWCRGQWEAASLLEYGGFPDRNGKPNRNLRSLCRALYERPFFLESRKHGHVEIDCRRGLRPRLQITTVSVVTIRSGGAHRSIDRINSRMRSNSFVRGSTTSI